MKILKAIIHLTMLVTTPALLSYPQTPLVNYVYSQEAQEWICPTTYDEIMQMLEDLESGELERKYSLMQLERVNDYLALLAKEGILPDEFDEEMTLEEDIEDLIYGEDSAFQLVHYLEESNAYTIIPAVFNGYSDYDIIQCGIISKAWKRPKSLLNSTKRKSSSVLLWL